MFIAAWLYLQEASSSQSSHPKPCPYILSGTQPVHRHISFRCPDLAIVALSNVIFSSTLFTCQSSRWNAGRRFLSEHHLHHQACGKNCSNVILYYLMPNLQTYLWQELTRQPWPNVWVQVPCAMHKSIRKSWRVFQISFNLPISAMYKSNPWNC
jgi:hypothetical protein